LCAEKDIRGQNCLDGERDCFWWLLASGFWLHEHMARERLSSRLAKAQRWLALKLKLRPKLGPLIQPYGGHPMQTGASQKCFTQFQSSELLVRHVHGLAVEEHEIGGLERFSYANAASINTHTLQPQLYNLLFSTLLNNTSLSGYGSTVILFNGFNSLAR
jgi:hypothetical protein